MIEEALEECDMRIRSLIYSPDVDGGLSFPPARLRGRGKGIDGGN